MKKIFLALLGFMVTAGMCSCSSSSTGTHYEVSLETIQTDWPLVREASGQWEVVGEAMFRNTGTETVVISSIALAVLDANGEVLTERSYGPDRFNDMILIVKRSPGGEYTQPSASHSQLAPMDLGLCHVAALAGASVAPERAQVTITFTNGRSEVAYVQLSEFDPGQQTIWPARFTGGDWVAVNTAEAYHHWSGINILGTTVGNSERFALDIMRIDAQYRLSNPPDSPNKEDYYSWGEDILSAGSGTVVDVLSDRIDQEIGTIDQAAGNHIIIQHGPKLYSFYAHMMRSSATVSAGDAVAAGQVIGKIGNSGKSTAPHLHFQYMEDKDFITAKGLPALFWGAKVNRLSDAALQDILGALPDIRLQNYGLTAGAYTMTGSTPLEYDLITAP